MRRFYYFGLSVTMLFILLFSTSCIKGQIKRTVTVTSGKLALPQSWPIKCLVLPPTSKPALLPHWYGTDSSTSALDEEIVGPGISNGHYWIVSFTFDGDYKSLVDFTSSCLKTEEYRVVKNSEVNTERANTTNIVTEYESNSDNTTVEVGYIDCVGSVLVAPYKSYYYLIERFD